MVIVLASGDYRIVIGWMLIVWFWIELFMDGCKMLLDSYRMIVGLL
jgi:hypothetical protein